MTTAAAPRCPSTLVHAMNTPPPRDLEADELELRDLFALIRDELLPAPEGFAERVATSARTLAQDARFGTPELTTLLSTGLRDAINSLTAWWIDKDDDDDKR
jgi:hypothetical protein